MIRQTFSLLPSTSLLYSHNPLRAFVLGGLALMVLAFAGPALSQIQLGTDIDGEAARDLSGYSVSMSSDGKRVAIGAPNANGGAGHVRVYDYNGTAWTQLGGDIDGEAALDLSGYSVSLSSDGKRVAIGAPENDSRAGHVRVYRFASASSAATPVPTLPLFGLGILVSLLGFFGLRKLRQ